jgi:hypothetical protein
MGMTEQEVRALLAEQEERHRKDLDALRASAAGTAFSTIPDHAGGPGLVIAPTWSQAEQNQARDAVSQPKADPGAYRADPSGYVSGNREPAKAGFSPA